MILRFLASMLGFFVPVIASAGVDVTISTSAIDPYKTTSSPLGNFKNLYLWLACGRDDGWINDQGITALEMGIASVANPDNPQLPQVIHAFNPADSLVVNIGTPTNLIIGLAGFCGVNPPPPYPRRLGTFIVTDNGGSFVPVPSQGGLLAPVNCTKQLIGARFVGYASHGGCPPMVSSSNRCPPYYGVGFTGSPLLGWDDGFGNPVGGGNGVSASRVHAVHTLTNPNALVVGGEFSQAGPIAANRIAQWNGSTWSALGNIGGGANDRVLSITEFEGNIIAGGVHPHGNIAQWVALNWVSLGTGLNGPVRTLLPVESRLYAGGNFTRVGPGGAGLEVNGIACWEGGAMQVWSDLDGGVMNGASAGVVWSLAEFNDDLIAGGTFDHAGGVAANNIARWTGVNWEPLGGGTDNTVRAMTLYEGDLLVAGEFAKVNGDSMKIARWDGAAWAPVACVVTPVPTRFETLIVYPSGSFLGDLVVTGDFMSIDGIEAVRVARWDGMDWRSVGAGLGPLAGSEFPRTATAIFQDDLYIGGTFNAVGANQIPSFGIARWDDFVVSGAPQPAKLALPALSVMPNPSAGAATVSYSLEGYSHVKVVVYDVRGRKIATLFDGYNAAGHHRIDWSGLDGRGTLAAPGVYFIGVEALHRRVSAKIVVSR